MESHLPPKSYFSSKVKIGPSSIHDTGLLAVEEIKKDDIIGIKDGYIIPRTLFNEIGGWHSKIGQSVLQIADDFFLGPRFEDEIPLTMMYVNHSCDPTVGFLGNCVCIAMRDIKPGEELTTDYAVWLADSSYSLKCSCQSPNCRNEIRGTDWQNLELQNKYRGYFSSYIQQKINLSLR